MNKGNQLIKGSSLRVIGLFVQIGITLVMMPFIIQTLGDRMYGLWVIIATFAGYYGMLDLGLSSAVVNYLSKSLNDDTKTRMAMIINTSFFIYLLIGFLVLSVSIIATYGVTFFLSGESDTYLFQKAVLILGVGIAIGMPVRTFNGILIAYLRHDLIAFLNMGRAISVNVLIYFFLNNGHGIIAIALVTLFVSLIEYSFCIKCAVNIAQIQSITLKLFNKNCARELFMYAGKTMIAQLADILRGRIAPFIIGAFLNLSMITFYEVAKRLVDTYSLFIQKIMDGVMPVFSRCVNCNYNNEKIPKFDRENDFRVENRHLILTN